MPKPKGMNPHSLESPDQGKPLALPLDKAAQVLGVDLVQVQEAAKKVEPYLHGQGFPVWSLRELSKALGLKVKPMVRYPPKQRISA